MIGKSPDPGEGGLEKGLAAVEPQQVFWRSLP